MTNQTTAPRVRVICLADVALASIPVPPPGTPTNRSWAELVEREPALGALRREMQALHRQPLGADWCAHAAWYGYRRRRGCGFKPRLVELVGWWARGEERALRTLQADDTAYQALDNGPTLRSRPGRGTPSWRCRAHLEDGAVLETAGGGRDYVVALAYPGPHPARLEAEAVQLPGWSNPNV